jgi:DNA-binding SARP family transcriptional activator
MINFSNRGKTGDAVKVYQKLKKTLRTELDADPDDVTRSIYENILDKNDAIIAIN